MITALDTSVLLDVLVNDPEHADRTVTLFCPRRILETGDGRDGTTRRKR